MLTGAGNRALSSLLQRRVTSFGGSTQDGKLTAAAQSHPVLREGSRGEAVVNLQRRLNVWGAVLVEDEVFGPLTAKAVRVFQGQEGLVADGTAGPLTWEKLDLDPDARNVDDTSGPASAQGPDTAVGVSALGPVAGGPTVGSGPARAEPDLAAMRRQGAGPFQQFVDRGLLDADVAALLFFMARSPATFFAHDTPEYAFEKLGSGELAGIVSDTPAARAGLAATVPASARNSILTAPSSTGGAATSSFTEGKKARGFVIVGSGFLPQTGPLRFPMLILSHELNHDRVRATAQFLEDSPVDPSDRTIADGAVAKQFVTRLAFVRKQFLAEVAARHVAWHVDQEYRSRVAATPIAGRTFPADGTFFRAMVDFAIGDPGAFFDTTASGAGYFPALNAKGGEALVGKQVSLWMGFLTQFEMHRIPSINDAIDHFIVEERDRSIGSGFKPTVPANKGDGMA